MLSASALSPAQGTVRFLPGFERGPCLSQTRISSASHGALSHVDGRPELGRVSPPTQPPHPAQEALPSASDCLGLGTPPLTDSLFPKEQIFVEFLLCAGPKAWNVQAGGEAESVRGPRR